MAREQGGMISIKTNCEAIGTALRLAYASGREASIMGVSVRGLMTGLSVGMCGTEFSFEGEAFRKDEWTGEGLPPEGIELEASVLNPHGKMEWVKAKVIHRVRNSVAVAHGPELGLVTWAKGWRPARTTEQIEAEVRKVHVDELARMMGDSVIYELAAKRLYDAGVRLPEGK